MAVGSRSEPTGSDSLFFMVGNFLDRVLFGEATRLFCGGRGCR